MGVVWSLSIVWSMGIVWSECCMIYGYGMIWVLYDVWVLYDLWILYNLRISCNLWKIFMNIVWFIIVVWFKNTVWSILIVWYVFPRETPSTGTGANTRDGPISNLCSQVDVRYPFIDQFQWKRWTAGLTVSRLLLGPGLEPGILADSSGPLLWHLFFFSILVLRWLYSFLLEHSPH